MTFVPHTILYSLCGINQGALFANSRASLSKHAFLFRALFLPIQFGLSTKRQECTLLTHEFWLYDEMKLQIVSLLWIQRNL
jgi:hypothetical protein